MEREPEGEVCREQQATVGQVSNLGFFNEILSTAVEMYVRPLPVGWVQPAKT